MSVSVLTRVLTLVCLFFLNAVMLQTQLDDCCDKKAVDHRRYYQLS